jgi:hypothetical protein
MLTTWHPLSAKVGKSSGGRSVGIVHSSTKATEFIFFSLYKKFFAYNVLLEFYATFPTSTFYFEYVVMNVKWRETCFIATAFQLCVRMFPFEGPKEKSGGTKSELDTSASGLC